MPQLPENLSFSELGGAKTDYDTVVDASTDRASTEINNAFCATAQMSRTSIRGWVRFTLDASATLVSSTSWDTVWKGATATPPVINLPSTGTWTITFPTSVLDEAGNSHILNLKGAHASLEGSGLFGFLNASCSSNVITVYFANTSGTLSTPASFNNRFCFVTFI